MLNFCDDMPALDRQLSWHGKGEKKTLSAHAQLNWLVITPHFEPRVRWGGFHEENFHKSFWGGQKNTPEKIGERRKNYEIHHFSSIEILKKIFRSLRSRILYIQGLLNISPWHHYR